MTLPLRLWLLGVRAIDRSPGLRQLHWEPRYRRWYFPVRSAALVRPSLRFLANELLRRSGTRRYRLRESGLPVVVRHPLNDMWILDEIYVQRVYEPPSEVLERVAELGRTPRILDLGGHAGLFALFALGRFPGASVTSLEPNPENAAVLDAARRAGGVNGRWELVRAAAGTAEGTATISGPSFLSTLGSNGGGTRVQVRDAFDLLGDADVAKIDIEGGEWPILEDERLARVGVRAVVFELHGDDEARARAQERLRAAGFETGPLFDERPDTACVWGWR